jgi:hypothetical protein
LHCPRCETTATPGARFCRQCGVRLAAPDAPAQGAPRGDDTAAADHGSPTAPDADEGDTAVISTAGVTATAQRSCPSCGAPNSPRRELCGRCGADLETGGTLPRSSGRSPERAPDEPLGEYAGRRWLPTVFGLVLVAGLIVLGLGLAGLGPFAQQVGMPSAEFDPTAYPDDAEGLLLSDIAARTTLESRGDEDFSAAQMVDDDPDTAWNSDGSQLEHGVGEVVDLFLAEPAWVERVVVTNGFQRDSDTYAANARLKRAAITFDGGERIVTNLLDLGLERQAVELPEPLLTTTIRIEVLETFPGDTHPDLAVSDLELQGWTALGDDAEVAGERAEVDRAAGASSE